MGLNASGQVAGSGLPAGDAWHAFVVANGAVTDLGTLPGYPYSAAQAINDAGQVAGSASTLSWYGERAFRHSGGVMTDLGTLGGPTSIANAINSVGHVVGTSDTAQENVFHAFLHDGDKMIDLGTLGGALSSANGINSAGQVVGSSTLANGGVAEFLYENGTMHNLQDLVAGFTDIQMAQINESGQIIGTGLVNGKWHGFLLTWVQDPAPQTMALKSDSLAAPEPSRPGKAAMTAPASLAAQRAAFALHAEATGMKCPPQYCTPSKKKK